MFATIRSGGSSRTADGSEEGPPKDERGQASETGGVDSPGGLSRREVLAGAVAAAGLTATAGCANVPSQPPAGDISRFFAWAVADQRVSTRVSVPRAALAGDGRDRTIPAAVAAARADATVGRLARVLAALTPAEADAFATAHAFAAAIRFETDAASTGRAEFVRYAAETLAAGVGDCEDKAVLLAGVLSRPPFDCDPVLLFLPGHAVVGVPRAQLPRSVGPNARTVDVAGTTYVYVESVADTPPGTPADPYVGQPVIAAYGDRWHLLNPDAFADQTVRVVEQGHAGAIEQYL